MTISSKLFATQMLDQFKVIENRLQSLNTQISTGTRITKSSDAPIDAVTLTARSELQSRIEQYQSNVEESKRALGFGGCYIGNNGQFGNPDERKIYRHQYRHGDRC